MMIKELDMKEMLLEMKEESIRLSEETVSMKDGVEKEEAEKTLEEMYNTMCELGYEIRKAEYYELRLMIKNIPQAEHYGFLDWKELYFEDLIGLFKSRRYKPMWVFYQMKEERFKELNPDAPRYYEIKEFLEEYYKEGHIDGDDGLVDGDVIELIYN